MFEVRFHGRGGQGVVTAAEMLSVAAFDEGRHAQAFPMFGSERTGAPVVSFCRIDDRPIRAHDPVLRPDAVVIQDPTLLHHVDVLAGAGRGAVVVVNSSRSPALLGLDEVSRERGIQVVTVPATELARLHLGRPLPNTALLGAVSALTGAVTLAGLSDAIRQRFAGDVGERNVLIAHLAFAAVADASEVHDAQAG
jgi:pyruvate ferredoxin oxidoreductase gamma subunit